MKKYVTEYINTKELRKNLGYIINETTFEEDTPLNKIVINGKLNMTLVNPRIGITYFLKQVTITSKLSISGL